MSHHFLRYCIAIVILFAAGCAINFSNDIDRMSVYYTATRGGEFETAPLPDRTLSEVVLPEIVGVSATSLKIGDTLTITGSAFSGFEGDKVVMLKNVQTGREVPVLGNASSTDSQIIFVLQKSYCLVDTSYSGLPCPEYVDITPGDYVLYATAWGATSTPVQLKISAK